MVTKGEEGKWYYCCACRENQPKLKRNHGGDRSAGLVVFRRTGERSGAAPLYAKNCAGCYVCVCTYSSSIESSWPPSRPAVCPTRRPPLAYFIYNLPCDDARFFFVLWQDGYDHSYFFIGSFVEDHVNLHADRLLA